MTSSCELRPVKRGRAVPPVESAALQETVWISKHRSELLRRLHLQRGRETPPQLQTDSAFFSDARAPRVDCCALFPCESASSPCTFTELERYPSRSRSLIPTSTRLDWHRLLLQEERLPRAV